MIFHYWIWSRVLKIYLLRFLHFLVFLLRWVVHRFLFLLSWLHNFWNIPLRRQLIFISLLRYSNKIIFRVFWVVLFGTNQSWRYISLSALLRHHLNLAIAVWACLYHRFPFTATITGHPRCLVFKIKHHRWTLLLLLVLLLFSLKAGCHFWVFCLLHLFEASMMVRTSIVVMILLFLLNMFDFRLKLLDELCEI